MQSKSLFLSIETHERRRTADLTAAKVHGVFVLPPLTPLKLFFRRNCVVIQAGPSFNRILHRILCRRSPNPRDRSRRFQGGSTSQGSCVHAANALRLHDDGVLSAVWIPRTKRLLRLVVRDEQVRHPTGNGTEQLGRKRYLTDERHGPSKPAAHWPLRRFQPNGLTAELRHRGGDWLLNLNESKVVLGDHLVVAPLSRRVEARPACILPPRPHVHICRSSIR